MSIQHDDRIVTTQRTSQDLKAWWLASWLAIIVGIWMTLQHDDLLLRGFGPLTFWFGVISLIVTKIRVWWNHS